MTDEQIEAVASDVAMLKRAIEEGDPKGELLIRLSDIAAAIAAMPDRFAEGAAQEKARVVGWLRDRWANGPGTTADLWFATAIERGEHLERGG